MKLAYQAMDKSGRMVNDVIEASDMFEATDQLRRDGLFVTTLREAGGDAPAMSAVGKRPARGGSQLKHVAMFTRQLSVLVSTGTPLVQAISALEKQSKDARWRAVVADIRRKIEGGESFAQALEDHPQHFDAIYRSLIEAGEAGGQLSGMLLRLARMTRQRIHVRNIVIGAMMYPAILMTVAVIVLSIMVGFVLPRFTGLFETLDAPLPPSTQFLLSISDFLRGYWWAVIPALGVAGVITYVAAGTESGRRALDTASLNIPRFGLLVRSFATARMTRLLGVLLESRVPLLDTLRLTRDGCTSMQYKQLLLDAENALTRGDNFSTVLARSDLIDPTITEAVRCGEQTGQMGSVLVSIAEFLDEENEVVLKSLSSIIEPVILIILGLLVGAVAISMFMPLFDITATVPGGGA